MNCKKRFQDCKSDADKALQYVLKKMCEVVNCDYETFDFRKDDWFLDYEWDENQEKEFIDWLEKEFENNKSLKVLVKYISSLRNKKGRKKLAKEFTYQYGWKYKK